MKPKLKPKPVKTQAQAAAEEDRIAEEKASRERGQKARQVRAAVVVLEAIKKKGVYWPGG